MTGDVKSLWKNLAAVTEVFSSSPSPSYDVTKGTHTSQKVCGHTPSPELALSSRTTLCLCRIQRSGGANKILVSGQSQNPAFSQMVANRELNRLFFWQSREFLCRINGQIMVKWDLNIVPLNILFQHTTTHLRWKPQKNGCLLYFSLMGSYPGHGDSNIEGFFLYISDRKMEH